MALSGKVQKHLGGVEVLTDTVAVEEIVTDAGDIYYRVTECTDSGIRQSTWPANTTPSTVFKLMQRLEEGGSRIAKTPLTNLLVGPHLMHKTKDRLIMNKARPLMSTTEFEVVVDDAIDLVWLDNLLHISSSSEEAR